MSMNTNYPRIRLNGCTDKWKTVTLRNIAKITMGQSPLAKNYTNNKKGYLLIQNNNDFKDGKVNPRLYTTQITKVSHQGDVLLTVRNPVGKSIINNKPTAVIGRGIANITSPYSHLLSLIFNRMDYLSQWDQYCVGTGASKSIKAKSLKRVRVSLPTSSQEQKAIQLLFKNLDHLIRLQIDKLNTLNQIKTGWLQKILNKNLYMKWHKYELKDLLKKGKMGTTPILKDHKRTDHQIPFLNLIDLNKANNRISDTKQHITESDIQHSNTGIVPKGSITLSMYGQIGKALELTKPMATSQSFFNMTFKDKINPDFMLYLFQKLEINDFWLPYVNAGSTVKNIRSSDVKKLTVYIPSLTTQDKVAKLFNQFDDVIYKNKLSLKLLKHFRQGCLQQVFC